MRASFAASIALITLLTLGGSPQSTAQASTEPSKPADTGTPSGVFKVGNGVTAPRAIYQPSPNYSKKARKAKYQGTCLLSLVVGADGKPHDIQVARSLGMGLDEEAVKAVQKWEFEPARKDGQPVPVEINVEVSFRLY